MPSANTKGSAGTNGECFEVLVAFALASAKSWRGQFAV
jgi:hypothetical protein